MPMLASTLLVPVWLYFVEGWAVEALSASKSLITSGGGAPPPGQKKREPSGSVITFLAAVVPCLGGGWDWTLLLEAAVEVGKTLD